MLLVVQSLSFIRRLLGSVADADTNITLRFVVIFCLMDIYVYEQRL